MKYNLEEAFEQLEKIKEESNIVLVKLDGAREKDTITVVISRVKSIEGTIQYHGNDLLLVINKAINRYYEVKST
ncbi:hypothetical protein V9L05_12315 [Bernardetia sp. Wsw4-3y2]|uniref:hypothetical protein n=1 Tax=unclassified Bernardetia TaxID=2647129 RepID=UPI0030D19974